MHVSREQRKATQIFVTDDDDEPDDNRITVTTTRGPRARATIVYS